MRLGVAGARGMRRGQDAVAKVIEFYVPSNFRKRERWIPPEHRGKLIEFCPTEKKTA